MSIPISLLKETDSRAVSIGVYSGPGLHKTHAIRTMPPKVLLNDFEGGSGSLMPWIHRRKDSSSTVWTEYTDEDRTHAWELLKPEFRIDPETGRDLIVDNPPAPLIDVVRYNPMRWEAYDEFVQDLGNFDARRYSSIATDSMQEFSQQTQTFSKGKGGEYNPMMLQLWGGAQERAAIAVRRLNALREQGLFIYVTGAEQIDMDYEQDPRSLPQGVKPDQPYIIKGTISVPGKLVNTLVHQMDILLHGRYMNGKPMWVAQREPVGSGRATWEVKDRFGRLESYNKPDFKLLLAKLYGKDTVRAIYNTARNQA